MSKKYLLVAIYLIFFILVLVSASDTTLPDIDFTNPTPSNGSSQSGDSIYVNVSTNDSSEHYAFVDFDKSLVLWIRGDDTNQSAGTLGAMFYDLSTYGMNGTAIGNATLNSGGRFGSAFQFNVTNGYVNVNTAGLTGALPKNETFSLWIKSDSTANRGIFEDGNSLVDASPQRLMQISTNKIRVLPCNAAYSGSTTTSITPGIWYHVAWVRNGTSNKIYINGTQEVDSAITATCALQGMHIGVGFSGYFNGTIDEMMVFNRTLSSSEILALYNASVNQYYNNFTSLTNGTHTFTGYAIDIAGNKNQTEQRSVIVNTSYVPPAADTIYPIFSDYWDDNATLIGNGIALFNVTVENTNGTVLLQINNTNYTAQNLTSNVYNVSVSLTNGTYSYYWGSWGNGTGHNYNSSGTRSYTVNSCITNLVNTSWSDWINFGICDIYDNQTQIRNLTQYDTNNCGEIANQTIYEYQNISCNYCSFNNVNTTKSDWYDITSCSIFDNKTQTRNWTEYDNNYSTCYAVTGLISDLFINVTWFENQTVSCNYCSYSIVNSSWTDWTNISCLADETMNQTRNKTEYDENYGTCYAITNLLSDLWNSGNNNTYLEFRNILDCGEQLATQTFSGGRGRTIITHECERDADCKTDYSCYSNKCVKLFDVKIVDIVSPIKSREFFNLTYYIRGMAEIKGDVIVTFWIQNERKRLDLGKDTIYLGILEEKTQTVKLFMPNTLEPGIYDFYTEVGYENYSAESYRKIEIIAPSTGMQINELDENETKDAGDIKETSPAGIKVSESIKNLFSNMRKGSLSAVQFVSSNKTYFFAGCGILLLIALISLLSWIFKNRKPKDMTRLTSIMGKKVYAENGNYIGNIKGVYLEDKKPKIYGWLIKLDKNIARKIKQKNVLLRHKHVKSIRRIMIIDEKVAEHLEKLGSGSA